MIALLCSLFAVIACVLFLVAWRAWDENRVLRKRLDDTDRAFMRRKRALDRFRTDIILAHRQAEAALDADVDEEDGD